MSITVSSPAKVNLFLKVLGKREDGYHEIRSLIQPISLSDELTIEAVPGDTVTVTCDSAAVPTGRENLAWRAAELFLERTGLKMAVRIDIVKKIPVAAGLGGGSSNAALVLRGLNELLGTGLGEEELMDIAASIGSDVPFFIPGGPAVVSGRGEILEKTTLPAYEYVLINPGFEVSARWAYDNLDLTKKGGDNILLYSGKSLGVPEGIKAYLYNDLEGGVLKKHQEISILKGLLDGAGALGSLMSGSGPTVFGVFTDGDLAARAMEDLERQIDSPAAIFHARGLARGL
ncbi:MAG: 4-(cytidine 5'-diphospho)-2-C-methyl-D-erythritol kinase [Thermodesulfobacteriota bacterium]